MIQGPAPRLYSLNHPAPVFARNPRESAGAVPTEIPDDRSLRARIGINLMNLRYRLGLKQGKAADLMGLSRTQWRKYEAGIETLRTDTAMSWCLLTGVSFYRLFCGTVVEKNHSHIRLLPNFDELSPLISPEAGSVDSQPQTGIDQQILPCDPDKTGQMRDELRREGARILGTSLRAVRHQSNFTQEHFADALGVSLSAYQNYEKHQKPSRFSLVFAGRLLHLTSLSPCDLFRSSKFHEVYSAREKQFFEWTRGSNLYCR